MIRDTISEDLFRKDEAARADLRAFLSSESGKKFAKALRGVHPLDALTTDSRNTPAGIRNAAMSESTVEGTAHNILGVLVGYEFALKKIDDLLDPWAEKMPAPPSKKNQIAASLRADRE